MAESTDVYHRYINQLVDGNLPVVAQKYLLEV